DMAVVVPIAWTHTLACLHNEGVAADRPDVDRIDCSSRAKRARLDPAVSVKVKCVEGGANPDDVKPDLLADPRPHRGIGPQRDLLVPLDDVVKLLTPEGGLVHPEDELALDVPDVDVDH